MICFLQRASEQFAVARSQNQVAATREAKLKELAAAYDSFSELKSNLTEGTKVENHTYSSTSLIMKYAHCFRLGLVLHRCLKANKLKWNIETWVTLDLRCTVKI